MLGFVPFLLCRVVCVWERSCVLRCWVVIPRWRSFCGRSCVDIVKILLCEGGDVDQWLSAHLLCRGLCLREKLSIPVLSCNSSMEVPLWKVLCGHSENSSVWRRGCRAVVQTSKHILVFALDLFSLSLSYILHYFTLYIFIYMLDIVRVPTLVFNQVSF